MHIRRYTPEDCKELSTLFYDTVHSVNARDYTQEQLQAWATGNADLVKWNQSFLKHHTLVAVENGVIAGALCDALEQSVQGGRIMTHASITAKPFFEKRGYVAVKEQQVERQGISLTNYVMEKDGSV